MKTKSDYIVTIIMIFFSTAHTMLTPVLHKKFDLNPPEFAVIGLAAMFLGFLNLARIKANNKIVSLLCLISNVLFFGWFCIDFIYEKSIQCQGGGAVIVICILCFHSIIDLRRHGYMQ